PALSHRSLPRKGNGPEHSRSAVRQWIVRAYLEPRPHRSRPDHRGGNLGGRSPRPLLRRDRRVARHGAQSPVPAPVARDHGAAVAVRGWRGALREGRGARRRASAERGGGAAQSVRGQYTCGHAGNNPIEDYRATPNVRPDSTTETYAALRLQIDNWRWAGVPFFLRTGKALETRVTEVAIKFKQAPF